MKHWAMLTGITITSIAAAICNLLIAKMTGFNLFALKIGFIFPVGAIVVGMVAFSGGLLATQIINAAPKMIDIVLMALLAVMSVLFIYYLDYHSAVFDDGKRASKVLTFIQYVDQQLRSSPLMFGRASRDVGEAGQWGYLLAAGDVIGFFFGGLSVFFILLEMELCQFCDVYLRKLKSKESNILDVDDAVAITEALTEGDLEVVSKVLHWKPQLPPQTEEGAKHAQLRYELWACPDCKSEQLVAKVNLFDGEKWTEASALTASRNLGPHVSLLDRFAS